MGGEPAHHILGETLALRDAPIELKQDNALREAVAAYFQQHEAVWELRARLCTNLQDMPIDDPTVEWGRPPARSFPLPG